MAPEELFDTFNVEKIMLEDMLSFVINALQSELRVAKRILSPYSDVNELTLELTKLFETVETVKSHMELTREILQVETPEQVQEVKERYSAISEEYGKILCKEDITCVPAKSSMAFIYHKMLLGMKKLFSECFVKGVYGETQIINTEENVNRTQILIGKFEVARIHFPLMVALKKDDLFCLEKSSEVWQDLYDSVVFKQINTKSQIEESSRRIHFLIRMSSVVVKRCVENKLTPSVGLLANLVKDLMYYAVKQGEADTQRLLHLMNSKLDTAFIVWNLPEKPFVSQFLALRHVTLGSDNQIFVPRIFPKITKELILQEYEDGTFNKIHPINKALLPGPGYANNRGQVVKDIFTPSEDKVPVRILSADPLNLREDGLLSFGGLKHRVKKTLHGSSVNDETAIVIHIHGGGFVSLSSLQHKVYLARWTKNSKMIHFSIDYRLAPKNQYPDPLDDVWQAYLWILNYAETVLGIKTPKIILAGDSAGGNLATCLTLRLIRAGLQAPHGLLLVYPCLAVDAKSYTPSYFLSIEDTMLPYSLLKLAAHAYTGEGFKNSEDPFITPIAASDELLEKMPPVTILCPAEDPLGDDNWRFMARLRQLNRNAKMIVHEHLSHGYLFHEELSNYDAYIDESCEEIKRLVSIA